MSRINYIMFEGYTGIVENIYDELGHKMMIAVELGVFQQALGAYYI